MSVPPEMLLEWIFEIISMIVFEVCSIFFFIKSRRAEMKSQKWFFGGLGLFFVFWGLKSIIFLFTDFIGQYIVVTFDPISIFYSISWKMGTGIGIAGLLSVILVLETYSVKSKYVFSIITIVGLILALVLPIFGSETLWPARVASYVFLPWGALSIIGLYTYLSNKLTGDVKRETILILVGFILICLGYVLSVELIKQSLPFQEIMQFIYPIVQIVGSLMFTIVYFRKE